MRQRSSRLGRRATRRSARRGRPTSSSRRRPPLQESTSSDPSDHHRPSIGASRPVRRRPGASGSGRRGSSSSAASARSSASASGRAPAPVLKSTAAPVRSGRWMQHGGEEARHGAAVADEDAVAAAVELEPEPPAERPRRLVGHRLHARHLVERLAASTPSAPGREEVGPAREIVDGRPEPAHRGDRPFDGEVRLDRDAVAVRDRRSSRSRAGPDGSSSVRASPSGSSTRARSAASYPPSLRRATISPSSPKARFE